MSERGDAIPVTVYLDRRTVDRIDEWAARMGHSRSRMLRFLVEDAVASFGVEYDIMTSAPARAMIKCLRELLGTSPEGGTVQSTGQGGGLVSPAA